MRTFAHTYYRPDKLAGFLTLYTMINTLLSFVFFYTLEFIIKVESTFKYSPELLYFIQYFFLIGLMRRALLQDEAPTESKIDLNLWTKIISYLINGLIGIAWIFSSVPPKSKLIGLLFIMVWFTLMDIINSTRKHKKIEKMDGLEKEEIFK